MLLSLRTVALVATLTCVVSAQSDQTFIQHYDGTTDATSRGGAGATAEKGLLQRIPGDQLCGRTAISRFSFIVQDQNATTSESYTVEVRRNDSAAPGTPNITAGGLLGSIGPISITFVGTGIAVAAVTETFSTPLALPPETGVSPADDLYVGLRLPLNPGWTADAISLHTSGAFFVPAAAGEQMRATAVGYSGAAGVAGLGWDVNFTASTKALGSANRSWNIATQFVDEVVQPFASNAAVFTGVVYNGTAGSGTGLNPNFGYAGIFPDTVRGDQPGWQVGSTQGAGVAMSVISTGTFAPFSVPGIQGSVCLDPTNLVFTPFVPLTPSTPPATGSFANFGPFPVPPLVGLIYVQVVVINLPFIKISTRICINF